MSLPSSSYSSTRSFTPYNHGQQNASFHTPVHQQTSIIGHAVRTTLNLNDDLSAYDTTTSTVTAATIEEMVAENNQMLKFLLRNLGMYDKYLISRQDPSLVQNIFTDNERHQYVPVIPSTADYKPMTEPPQQLPPLQISTTTAPPVPAGMYLYNQEEYEGKYHKYNDIIQLAKSLITTFFSPEDLMSFHKRIHQGSRRHQALE